MMIHQNLKLAEMVNPSSLPCGPHHPEHLTPLDPYHPLPLLSFVYSVGHYSMGRTT